jgi:hypothetical protein
VDSAQLRPCLSMLTTSKLHKALKIHPYALHSHITYVFRLLPQICSSTHLATVKPNLKRKLDEFTGTTSRIYEHNHIINESNLTNGYGLMSDDSVLLSC